MDAIRALFLVKSMKPTGLRNMCFKCKQLNWQKRRPSTLPLNIQLYIWPNKKGLCIMKILIYNIYMYLYTIILCFFPFDFPGIRSQHHSPALFDHQATQRQATQ